MFFKKREAFLQFKVFLFSPEVYFSYGRNLGSNCLPLVIDAGAKLDRELIRVFYLVRCLLFFKDSVLFLNKEYDLFLGVFTSDTDSFNLFACCFNGFL